MFDFVDPSPKHRFILTHGDLRPPNIIVDDDLNIIAIINWEWSSTVPRQFNIPPLWLAGTDIPILSKKLYQTEYSKLHRALLDAAEFEPASRIIADEWGPDLSSSINLYLPAALLYHQNFMLIYFLFLFP